MWILAKDKKTVVNLDRCEYIGLGDEIQAFCTATSFKAFTPDSNYLALGEYDPERAAQVFDELLTSLAKGDQLFRMPEK